MINDISQKFLNNHECELHKLDLGHGNISFVYHNKYHESKKEHFGRCSAERSTETRLVDYV